MKDCLWLPAALSLVFVSLAALEAQTPPDVPRWLEAVDASRNAFAEAVISARATQIVNGKTTGSAEFDIYTKGPERGLIVFRGGKNSGRKVLTVGDRMWLIVPGATHPVPITANQRLMGGASMGDVARLRFSQDFTATVRPGIEEVNGKPCRVLELTAKSPRAPYPRVVLWYDEAARLPGKVSFFLPSGKEAKQVTFTKFSRTGGKPIVSEMEVRDLLSSDSRAVTRVEYLSYKPAKLDDAIFTTEGARGL